MIIAAMNGVRLKLTATRLTELEFTGIGSGLLTPMPYRAVPVKVAKKKTKEKR